jgi:hypothetical protein
MQMEWSSPSACTSRLVLRLRTESVLWAMALEFQAVNRVNNNSGLLGETARFHITYLPIISLHIYDELLIVIDG